MASGDTSRQPSAGGRGDCGRQISPPRTPRARRTTDLPRTHLAL